MKLVPVKVPEDVLMFLPKDLDHYQVEDGAMVKVGGTWVLMMTDTPQVSPEPVVTLPVINRLMSAEREPKIVFFPDVTEEYNLDDFENEISKSVECAQAALKLLNDTIWMSSTRIVNRIIDQGYDVTASDIRLALFHLTTTGVVERVKKKTLSARQKVYHYRLK